MLDSIHYWYRKLYNEFFDHINCDIYLNTEFTDEYPFYRFSCVKREPGKVADTLIFFDQEPLYDHFFLEYRDRVLNAENFDLTLRWFLQEFNHRFLFVSEKSKFVDILCRKQKFKKIYYFFHGFAVLDWYRNYWKDDIKVNLEHEYLFVSYQHLLNQKRTHRLDFLCRLLDKDLLGHGLVSFKKPNDTDTIVNNTRGFTDESREIYQRNKHRLTNLYIDTQNPVGSLSTSINVPESQRAFVQVVTETVYFAEKLHLTEKVFKPIVCKQPFLLLAARGNLAYFRDYGFKTFGEFWDESYDDISDPGQRVQAVVDIIDGLSKIPRDELIDMKKSMIPILEHNFNHFYYEFKDIISREFEDNIKAAFATTSIKIPPERWDRLAKALRF